MFDNVAIGAKIWCMPMLQQASTRMLTFMTYALQNAHSQTSINCYNADFILKCGGENQNH